MRIISGTYKGRRFNPAGLKETRPTTDFAREGLFNILNNKLNFNELSLLDLFSGSGAVAFEFISRGVKKATAVDQNGLCLKFIQNFARELGIEGLSLIKSDVLKFVERNHGKYDVVFADPPFKFDKYQELIELIFEKELIQEDGMLIVEHEKKTDLSVFKGFAETRNFGNVHFSFFYKP